MPNTKFYVPTGSRSQAGSISASTTSTLPPRGTSPASQTGESTSRRRQKFDPRKLTPLPTREVALENGVTLDDLEPLRYRE